MFAFSLHRKFNTKEFHHGNKEKDNTENGPADSG